MKIKLVTALFLVSALGQSTIDTRLDADVISAQDELDLKETDFFYDPIDFTPSGCRCFFRHRFNHPQYVIDFLPYNFSHIVDFLGYGKRTYQDNLFIQAIFELFTNKIDNVSHVDVAECTRFFERIPFLLEAYFPCSHRDKIKELITQAFKETRIKRSDNEEKIELLVDQLGEESELRKAVMIFIKSALSKVMWNHYEGVRVWDSFKALWQSLVTLREKHIVEYSVDAFEDITSLHWALIHRFAYFIELFGSELPLECYEQAREDLAHEVLPLLDIEEYDAEIMNKREVLEGILFVGDVKAQARQQYGILSEDIIHLRT